jgi:hypothetical protein
MSFTAQDVERELKQRGLWAAFLACETAEDYCEFSNQPAYACIRVDMTQEDADAFVEAYIKLAYHRLMGRIP